MDKESRARQSALRAAARAEEQAIGIYEAEVFWRGERVFSEILQEEIAHKSSLSSFSPGPARAFDRWSGRLLGSLLSLLPRRICYRLHEWAEAEAARIYEAALERCHGNDLNSAHLSELQKALSHAAKQEWEHSRRFRDMAKNPLS